MRLSKKFVSEYSSLENIDFHEYADKMVKLIEEMMMMQLIHINLVKLKD